MHISNSLSLQLPIYIFDYKIFICHLQCILNQNEQSAPSAIVMDIIYAGTTNDADDKEFAEACKEANNVITAVDVVRHPEVPAHIRQPEQFGQQMP